MALSLVLLHWFLSSFFEYSFKVLQVEFIVLSGCLPNITRNAIVNCSELVTYDIIKELILKYNLMTGKCFKWSPQHFRHFVSPLYCSSLWPLITKLNILTKYFGFYRQHAVPLHRRLRSRFLHHHCSVSGGCGKNTLHEFSARAVRRRY